MEDFVAGFRETADRYSSAADWIVHQLATWPSGQIRDRDRYGPALRHGLAARVAGLMGDQPAQSARSGAAER